MLTVPSHVRIQANKAICAWCPDGAGAARIPQCDVICVRDEEPESGEVSLSGLGGL